MTLLLGIFAVMLTPREEEPQINVTMADVLIPFPGAAVRDVAQMVAGAGTDHRRRARDVGVAARPGRHHRAVQGGRAAHRDAGAAVYRCALERGLAAEITQRRPGLAGPSIKPKGIDDVPIVTLTLFSKNTGTGTFDLERIAHSSQRDLKRVAGTREISTIGGPGRAVMVEIDPAPMASIGVTAPDPRQALLSVSVRGGKPVFMRDVATVRDGPLPP